MENSPKKANRFYTTLHSIWKELLFFIIGVAFNSLVCYPKKSFILKGIAKDENYNILKNANVEIIGIGNATTNDNGEFLLPKFRTKLPLISIWPGCNCIEESMKLEVIITLPNSTQKYSKLDSIYFSEQVSDTLFKNFYLIKNEY